MHASTLTTSGRVLAVLAATGLVGTVQHAPITRPAAGHAARIAALAWLRAAVATNPNIPAPGTSPTPAVSGGITRYASDNWSGYADTASGAFTSASARWVQPSITCQGKENELAALWVGIDGFNTSTVEQDGTIAWCYEGSAYAADWWEMYPTNDIQVVNAIAPGDAITATVTRSGTSYTLAVTDSTNTAASFATTQSCASTICKDESAEWIAEAPDGYRGLWPLAHFKTWGLMSAAVATSTASGTITTFTPYRITMVDSAFGGSSYPLAAPGNLSVSAGLDGFPLAWRNSY
jgi:hypothetical protein